MRYQRSSRLAAVAVFAALLFGACTVPPPGAGDIITETFTLGTWTIDADDDVELTIPAPGPGGQFGVVGMDFRVVDETGNEVGMMDGVHLHHIVLQNTSAVDPLCPGRAERFGGSGMEKTPIRIPDPYAYLVDDGDAWQALFHLMNVNQSGDPLTLSIEYDILYRPNANPQNVRPVTPLYMDTTGCGNSNYEIPGDGGPGSVHTNSATWTAPADGTAVYTGSHMHAGSIEGRLIGPNGVWCAGTSEYNGMGHLVKIPACQLDQQILEGQDFSVEIDYGNDEYIPDAMGLNFTFVWWGTQ